MKNQNLPKLPKSAENFHGLVNPISGYGYWLDKDLVITHILPIPSLWILI